LIIISAKYRNIWEKNLKEKILQKFNNYENQLKKDNTKYSKTILEFVLDLKWDLENNRELNIDKLNTDEYLENYLLVKDELNIYNSLINQDIYRKIFDKINEKKDISDLFLKFQKQYYQNLKKLNTKIIAKNLLIFTCFKRSITKKYLMNLYLFTSWENKEVIKKMILDWNFQISEIKKLAINYYKKNNFNYKYIWFQNINWKSILNDKIIDCSKFKERTWKPRYEYKKLILGL